LIASRFWWSVSFGLRPNFTPLAFASARPRAGVNALSKHSPLEFGECSSDRKHTFSDWRGGIYVLLVENYIDVAGFERLNCVE
jgi:hypothetical protein